MSIYIPNLFISTGETGAMFTLRETYEHDTGDGETAIWSLHLTNLSTTFNEAVIKAKKFAQASGMKLTVSNNLEQELREIMRSKARSSDEIKAERLEREAASILRRQRGRDEHEAESMNYLFDGKMPIGKYRGDKLEECPVGYLNWLVDNVKDFEDESIFKDVATVIKSDFKNLIMPKPNKKKHVGAIGSRCEFKATVISSFRFDNEWGTTYFTTLVTKDKSRNCIMVKSGAFNPDVGEILTFKATIKAHDIYNGQAQTVVQRVKVQS